MLLVFRLNHGSKFVGEARWVFSGVNSHAFGEPVCCGLKDMHSNYHTLEVATSARSSVRTEWWSLKSVSRLCQVPRRLLAFEVLLSRASLICHFQDIYGFCGRDKADSCHSAFIPSRSNNLFSSYCHFKLLQHISCSEYIRILFFEARFFDRRENILKMQGDQKVLGFSVFPGLRHPTDFASI
jgi:hypothetical protein